MVDTIVDTVYTPEHQREPDGLDQRVDKKLCRKFINYDILSAIVAKSSGWQWTRSSRADSRVGCARPATSHRAVYGVGGAWSRFTSPVLASRTCSRSRARPEVSDAKILTIALDSEIGAVTVHSDRSCDGYRLTGVPTPRSATLRWPARSWFTPMTTGLGDRAANQQLGLRRTLRARKFSDRHCQGSWRE
uniref:B229_F3_123 n=1 Tax=Mycobacterium leprae TaxID=1769 RepID=Q49880_MYCLR|nr:B229_F3_123 [Mycobacterium leprae]